MVASRVLLWAILCCCTQSIYAAPTLEGFSSQIGSSASPKATACFPCHQTIPYKIDVDDVESLLLSPWSSPYTTVSSNTVSDYQQYPFSFSYITTASAPIPYSTLTITITKEEPTTITVSLAQTTITEILTVTGTSITSTPTSSIPSTTPDMTLGATKTAWFSPPNMTDLSSFQVSKFSGGEKNMKIIPYASAGDSDSDLSISSQEDAFPESKSSVMQLLYPANSIDPGQKPQGGAEFYASPIDISDARNVTMGYNVFFAEDFDWVLGGKLPGLYGGHSGCSGGNAALDCFSTRLMWRQDGAGELYLYAPKDKQTVALCSDPASVCDAAYGLSVGRGLFNWQAGSWTAVQQTVYLNTPGKQDGQFTLQVNGERAIYRDDIFYRDDINAKRTSIGKPTKTVRPKKTSTKKQELPTTTSTDDGNDGGLLGPILGGILAIWRRGEGRLTSDGSRNEQDVETSVSTPMHRERQTALVPRLTASSTQPSATPTVMVRSSEANSLKESEVKFVGIFFSTFFGGHEPKYATPQDQHVWFKDFSLTYNA
ncbi:hypothetical protein CVT25_008333 [Psilocybe cyanescens]|uniref:Polysaccharide lyase 14 domain-containing protein n=1 Tax=Psilocybe cyanescens TaxID=93625 RepID=A0A409WV42_PSICY|nr:hypothetical protein CVT25_008333 [Psilocybe cyanescens]